jgi:YVTN family beta-propeller protein
VRFRPLLSIGAPALALLLLTGVAGAVLAQGALGPCVKPSSTPPSPTGGAYLLLARCPRVPPSHAATAVHAAAAVITVGNNPFYDAVNPLTNQIYVANYIDGSMSVINGANNSVITVPATIGPYGVAVNPATGNVYLTSPIFPEVLVFSASGALITTITDPSFDEPTGVAVNPATNMIYVANGGCTCGNTVSVISGATNTVVAVVPVGGGPFAVAVNSVTNRIYVTNCDDGTISVINGATNTVIGPAIPDGNPPGSSPQGIAVNPVTNKIYVTDQAFGTLLTIDGNTNTPGTPQVIGFSPTGVAVDAIRNIIYVADPGASQAYAVNGSNGSETTLTDPSFAGTYWVALNLNTNLIYFTNASSNTVTVLQGPAGPVATSPTESCTPMVVPPGVSTTCTVVLTSPIPAAGTISKTITAPAGATITSCANTTGGLACGSQPNPSTLNLTCQSFVGSCAAGSSFQVVIAGASTGPLSQTIALTPPGGGTAVSFTLNGLTTPASATSIGLSSSQNPSAPGQPVTFTAIVGCPGFTATGTVTFTIDGTPGSPVTLTNGSASYTASGLSPGSHTVSATYSGDGNCIASTSTPLTQVVNQTGLTLTSSANPSPIGQPVTLAATLTCLNGSPSGTVTFLDNGTPIASLPLNTKANPPIAAFATSTLAPGSHSITATYSGGGGCAAATSNPLTQVVGAAANSVMLTSSQNPSTPGQPVTFTATPSCPGFTATGIVTFTIDGAVGVPVKLIGGTASLTTSGLTPGSHSVSAVYSGDVNCGSATSAVLMQSVNATGTGALAPGALTNCQALSAVEQQACIAQATANLGAVTCPTVCSPLPAATKTPGPLPGTYCTTPDGTRLWVPKETTVPPSCIG